MKTNYSIKHVITMVVMLFMGLTSFKSQAQLLNCQANFSYWVNPNGAVVFYDSSYVNSGQVTQFLWSFGDGTTSAQPNTVTHIYPAAGNYTACLYIVTSNGCSDTVCQIVTVPGNCQMNAVITNDTTNSTLIVTTTGGTPPYLYIWTYNGISQTTTIPTLPYNSFGVYCVTVSDANNCTTSNCISVGGSLVCQASFSFTQLSPGSFYFNNLSTGNGLSYFWNFGDSTTSTQTSPIHTYQAAGTYMVCLNVIDTAGNICDSYCAAINVLLGGGNSVICGNIFNDINANGVSDSTDTGLGGQTISIWGNGMQGTVVTDSNGNYTLNVSAGTYYLYYCAQFPNTITVPTDSFGCAFYTVTVAANDTSCGYNFGVTANTVVISGHIYHDANNNGVYDFGETGIPYQPVTIGSSTVYTNSFGEYTSYEAVGTYTITYVPTGVYAGFALSTPGSITVNATTVGNTYWNNDFGLNIPAGSNDLSVNLSPSTNIAPGFSAWYYITVTNTGVLPASGVVTYHYPTGLTFDKSTPNAATVNATTQTITWNVNNIPAFSSKTIWVDFNASTTLPLGTLMLSMVDVTLNTGTDPNMISSTSALILLDIFLPAQSF